MGQIKSIYVERNNVFQQISQKNESNPTDNYIKEISTNNAYDAKLTDSLFSMS